MERAPVHSWFDGPAGPISCYEWGAAGAGPSLLLLHATGFHARLWNAVVSELPADTHVLAPDFRGHGLSHRPATMADWAATALDLLPLVEARLPSGAIGVGHSMGGTCAVHLAAALPDHFARLVLVDPVIMAPETYAAAPGKAAPDPSEHPVARRRNRWAGADEMIAHFSGRAPYSAWRAEVLTDYCRWGLVPAADGNGYELACPPLLEASVYLGNAGREALTLLHAIPCPVSVVRGRRSERGFAMDFSSSPTWPDLAAHFPAGRDLHWDDLSHFIPMEAPARLAGLITAELAAGA